MQLGEGRDDPVAVALGLSRELQLRFPAVEDVTRASHARAQATPNRIAATIRNPRQARTGLVPLTPIS
ncbi:hypothetical protein [Cryptosporangium sp. NPDC048952]|uniref:hypothetical protein n=1 Tax=Cryptosporangium sp. NPDC048952 TaxID=3363961 RepID=UPI003718B758